MLPMSRLTILHLAALAGVDPRTAKKALRDGAGSVRGLSGDRIAVAMRELGLSRPDSIPPPASP